MPDDRIPPSPYARLTMFCALVDEYDEIAEAFPVYQDAFRLGGPPREPSDRWHRLVRAMVLRKFVLQDRDHAHLSRVTAALRQCASDESAGDAANAIDDHLRRLTTRGPFYQKTSKSEAKHANDVVEEIIYGGFMHADYGKWERTKDRANLMVEHPLWHFTKGTEELVRAARDSIRALDGEGKLLG